MPKTPTTKTTPCTATGTTKPTSTTRANTPSRIPRRVTATTPRPALVPQPTENTRGPSLPIAVTHGPCPASPMPLAPPVSFSPYFYPTTNPPSFLPQRAKTLLPHLAAESRTASRIPRRATTTPNLSPQRVTAFTPNSAPASQHTMNTSPSRIPRRATTPASRPAPEPHSTGDLPSAPQTPQSSSFSSRFLNAAEIIQYINEMEYPGQAESPDERESSEDDESSGDGQNSGDGESSPDRCYTCHSRDR